VYQAELIETAIAMLEISSDTIEQAIAHELDAEHIVADRVQGQPCLFLTPLYRAEVGVAIHLHHLMERSTPWGRLDPDTVIPGVEQ
jgi:exodeoxyribonuclease V alpha subunit